MRSTNLLLLLLLLYTSAVLGPATSTGQLSLSTVQWASLLTTAADQPNDHLKLMLHHIHDVQIGNDD